ncbi:MAG: hypothetical protein Q8N44_14545 [Rubrivivax sp.]|nr:hypothetical protein [Rubrivivax sp.]MDP3084890.1 hypothetical protein [Rubrivivax sp.]
MEDSAPPTDCCEGHGVNACVFAKALLARALPCALAQRRDAGERVLVECPSPPARAQCARLYALMHERARFALRLPLPGRPLTHMQALRLQCGGLKALQQQLASEHADVHQMVGAATARHGDLADLPWAPLVAALAAWQAPRRGRPRP